jgi:hypothetical protein
MLISEVYECLHVDDCKCEAFRDALEEVYDLLAETEGVDHREAAKLIAGKALKRCV